MPRLLVQIDIRYGVVLPSPNGNQLEVLNATYKPVGTRILIFIDLCRFNIIFREVISYDHEERRSFPSTSVVSSKSHDDGNISACMAT